MPWFLIGNLIWLLVLGSGLVLALLVIFLIGVAGASLPGVGISRVMLNCPHCGADTPASEPECRSCRRSFREESTRYKPVIDAPKLRMTGRESNVRDKPLATTDVPRYS